MNKYLVTIYFSDAFQYELDAENEDRAEEIATKFFRDEDGIHDIDGVEVELVCTDEEGE